MIINISAKATGSGKYVFLGFYLLAMMVGAAVLPSLQIGSVEYSQAKILLITLGIGLVITSLRFAWGGTQFWIGLVVTCILFAGLVTLLNTLAIVSFPVWMLLEVSLLTLATLVFARCQTRFQWNKPGSEWVWGAVSFTGMIASYELIHALAKLSA